MQKAIRKLKVQIKFLLFWKNILQLVSLILSYFILFFF